MNPCNFSKRSPGWDRSCRYSISWRRRNVFAATARIGCSVARTASSKAGRTSILTGPPSGERFRFLLRLHNHRRARVLQGIGHGLPILRCPSPKLVLRDGRHRHEDEAAVRKNLQLHSIPRPEVRTFGDCDPLSRIDVQQHLQTLLTPKDTPKMGNGAILIISMRHKQLFKNVPVFDFLG